MKDYDAIKSRKFQIVRMEKREGQPGLSTWSCRPTEAVVLYKAMALSHDVIETWVGVGGQQTAEGETTQTLNLKLRDQDWSCTFHRHMISSRTWPRQLQWPIT